MSEEKTKVKKAHPILRSIPIALADALFINLAIWMAGFLDSYLLKGSSQLFDLFWICVLPIAAASIVIFALWGTYRMLWQYMTLPALLRLIFACLCSTFAAYVILRIAGGYWQPPIIAAASFYLFATLAIGLRSIPSLIGLIKVYFGKARYKRPQVPMLVVGAGNAADMFLKDFSAGNGRKYRVVGLVDDDFKKQGQTLRGYPILGNIESIPDLVSRYSIAEIIIAIPSLKSKERKRILSICLPTGCKIKAMNSVIHVQEYDAGHLQELNINDLLGRDEVYLDRSVMSRYIGNSVVLVTGGGGSIGSELCRQIISFDPAKLIIFDFYENNGYDIFQELRMKYPHMADKIHLRIGSVQDASRLKEVFEEFSPELVFHAAAYKHVPLMEQCPRLAVENNIFGSYQLAVSALMHKVKRFVMISTDKAVNPTNVMGASKRITEMILQSLNGQGTEFVAVRFGNVLGSNGSVVPIFKHQIENGGPVTVTHPEVIRYFMTIPEATRLVLQAGAMAKGGETFVLDMGEPIKIQDLAETMIKIAGLEPGVDIDISYTGLRPGEKLYEELLLSEEGVQKTEKDKIFVACGEIIDENKRVQILSKLRLCLEQGDDVKSCLKEILPSYQPDLA